MASRTICPKGHTSSDSDFCSECGARIQSTSASSPASPHEATGATGKLCPDCGAPAPSAGVNFCEICGYNFVTQTSGQFPGSAKPSQPQAVPSPAGYRLVITVDASLRTDASPDAPVNIVPLVYVVDKPISLIGRKSEARAIFPDISLNSDVAVSHRHGVVSRTPDAQLVYRDLSSSNGTRLNGIDVKPLTDTPLKNGDQLTLGHWTRISVETNS